MPLVVYDVYSPKVRLGPDHDSGYVLNERLLQVATRLISCGVGEADKFEQDWFLRTHTPVEMYEGAYPSAPILSAFPDEVDKKLWYVQRHVGNRALELPLASIIKDKKDALLKLDIECAEYWTLAITDIEHLCGVIFECHDLYAHWNAFERMLVGPLAKFFCFHVHGNNFGAIFPMKIGEDSYALPGTMELSFIRKDLVTMATPDTAPYPQEIDKPCNPQSADIKLDWINKWQ